MDLVRIGALGTDALKGYFFEILRSRVSVVRFLLYAARIRRTSEESSIESIELERDTELSKWGIVAVRENIL